MTATRPSGNLDRSWSLADKAPVAGLVSVIIITLDRKPDLIDCLDSLQQQDYDQLEIIVVDNGSKDGTTDHLRNARQDIKVIRNETNLGGCISRNQGISEAQVSSSGFLTLTP